MSLVSVLFRAASSISTGLLTQATNEISNSRAGTVEQVNAALPDYLGKKSIDNAFNFLTGVLCAGVIFFGVRGSTPVTDLLLLPSVFIVDEEDESEKRLIGTNSNDASTHVPAWISTQIASFLLALVDPDTVPDEIPVGDPFVKTSAPAEIKKYLKGREKRAIAAIRLSLPLAYQAQAKRGPVNSEVQQILGDAFND